MIASLAAIERIALGTCVALEVTGLLLAVPAAPGWAAYMVLTQQVGGRFEGLGGPRSSQPRMRPDT